MNLGITDLNKPGALPFELSYSIDGTGLNFPLESNAMQFFSWIKIVFFDDIIVAYAKGFCGKQWIIIQDMRSCLLRILLGQLLASIAEKECDVWMKEWSL